MEIAYMTDRLRPLTGGKSLRRIVAAVLVLLVVQGIPVQLDNSSDGGAELAYIDHITLLLQSKEHILDNSMLSQEDSDFLESAAFANFSAGLDEDLATPTTIEGLIALVESISEDQPEPSPQNEVEVAETNNSPEITIESILEMYSTDSETNQSADTETVARAEIQGSNGNASFIDRSNRIGSDDPALAGSSSLLAYAPSNSHENIEILSNPKIFANQFEDDSGGVVEWIYGDLPISVISEAEQKCLAEAVYFEARGESVDGQVAVAQVVLNRVHSSAFPNSICGVVYQNQLRRHKCQFSFACDGVAETVHSRIAWRKAKIVASNVTYGVSHLQNVGASTHYHADYVSPVWAKSMEKKAKVGQHIFYLARLGG